MGLSICYEFRANVSANEARQLVHALHEAAVTLPFQQVMDVAEIGTESATADDRWLELMGMQYGRKQRPNGEEYWIEIPPRHAIGFGIRVAEGSETAHFGLATHPPVIERMIDGHRELVETGLTGVYSWAQCCKTQYAGLQQFGGEENFLTAHLGLIEMLDHAAGLGIEVQAHDDSGYFEHRDEEQLVRQLREWNGLVAAFAGQLKDRLGRGKSGIQAPIFTAPDFEHLEAEGMAQWQDRSDEE